ncbi:hypothetical protein ACFSQJ_07480 [Croceitalea marina]|uniref:Uncharacterized protein n=1 Tax=Croceitalea marina TaxID=1775166 RepID=A0ABW5MUM6_9FLAO
MSALYSKIDNEWNQNFMGYSALAIILSTCVGSLAILTTIKFGNSFSQMFQIFLVVVACSAHNASILTVQKPSLVLKLLITSLVVSSSIIFIGLL